MRIAIVGSGISGLTAAHLLHQEHEVTLFEADDRIGGHTSTVEVEHERFGIDTGFIVFNDRNYPNFERLLDSLGVESQPSSMSFSVCDAVHDFEYSSGSANGLYSKRSHLVSPTFHRMVLDLARFNRDLRPHIGTNGTSPGLGDFLEEGGYSQAFVDRLIVPQVAAVWSADPRDLDSFPTGFLASFFHNHGMLSFFNRPNWRTVKGGSHRYVEAMIRPFADRIHTATPVRSITRHEDRVELATESSGPLAFDHVVLATQSDQSLSMLADPTQAEREVLGAIPYQPSRATLHTDASMLPRRRRTWASWNYHLLPEPPPGPALTYHMNRLQSLESDTEYCVTLNREDAIDPDSVIAAFDYSHPVFTHEGQHAQTRHREISTGRTHYCGAYWGWGFHEDGVASALKACEPLGGGTL